MLRKLHLTLWEDILIDAGDDTDVEASVNLKTLMNAQPGNLTPDYLNRLHNAALVLTLGTETGLGSFTLDSFDVSRNGGTNWRIVQRYAQVFDTAGVYQIPLTEPILFGGSADALLGRLSVTVTQLSGSHKFASSKLELMGNLWMP